MASAFYRQDRQIWIADFRGYGTPEGGKRSSMRVPKARLRTEATASEDAKAFADECERYCRIIEGKHQPEDIQHARRLGVISVTQADALSAGRYVPLSAKVVKRLTIRDAAISHPSSQRDNLTSSVRYLGYVDAFVKFSGISHLVDLTHDHVTSWVNDLRKRGWAWDSRRHALIYLRRACAIGPRHGFPDVLAEMPVDRRDAANRPVIRVWTLDQLMRQISVTEDDNECLALILGGLVGLRPTEILGADVPHLDRGGVLQTGAKTAASIRSLPLPAIALKLIRQRLGKRKTGPMLAPHGPRSGPRYTLSGLHQLLRQRLKGPPCIGPKDLRKTFATWASRVIEANDLERFLGHASALYLPVTTRHYLATYAAEQLRPAAALLDRAIVAAMPKAKRQKARA